jgi:hypothetical protein
LRVRVNSSQPREGSFGRGSATQASVKPLKARCKHGRLPWVEPASEWRPVERRSIRRFRSLCHRRSEPSVSVELERTANWNRRPIGAGLADIAEQRRRDFGGCGQGIAGFVQVCPMWRIRGAVTPTSESWRRTSPYGRTSRAELDLLLHFSNFRHLIWLMQQLDHRLEQLVAHLEPVARPRDIPHHDVDPRSRRPHIH